MGEKRILVVDDEDDIREVARVSLELIGGFTVLVARSGHEAVTVACNEHPDVILLDVMMPDVDGVATYQTLQADKVTSSIPVIFLTAKLQVADRRRFAGLGAKSIIAKPFDPLALPMQVKGALGW